MSTTSPSSTPATPQEMIKAIQSKSTLKSQGRPLGRQIMHYVRRGHLYIGLFMIPWVLLYGITGFLFNHPEAFPDKNWVSFDSETLRGTSLENIPSPTEQAREVVDALNEELKPAKPFRLGKGEAKYAEGMMNVQIAARDQNVTLQYNPNQNVGTVRSAKNPPSPEKSPFDVGQPSVNNQRELMMAMMAAMGNPKGKKLEVKDPLAGRVKAATPTICEKTGFPSGDIKVLFVPDLIFPIDVDGTIWTAKYNSRSGTVSGTSPGTSTASEMSFRRFLLGLHFTHRYPGEINIKWFWALVVDVMAFVMCFWSASGLLMWWQIKATRRWGVIVLLLSSTAATVSGVAMHAFLAA